MQGNRCHPQDQNNESVRKPRKPGAVKGTWVRQLCLRRPKPTVDVKQHVSENAPETTTRSSTPMGTAILSNKKHGVVRCPLHSVRHTFAPVPEEPKPSQTDLYECRVVWPWMCNTKIVHADLSTSRRWKENRSSNHNGSRH